MYKDFYRESLLMHLPLFTLILFLAIFLGTLAWLFIFQRKSDRFSNLAKLPLEPDAGLGAHVATKESER